MPLGKKSSKTSKKLEDYTFELPVQISSMSTVVRTRQEVENLLTKARSLNKDLSEIEVYNLTAELISPEVRAVFEKNNIKTADQISQIRDWLEQVRTEAPRVHITLAGTTPRSFAEKVVAWFRDEIYKDLIVDFHVSHDIGGGFILRTPNHIHDFSWRKRLNENPLRIAELVNDAR